ncbi:hypothetical protein LX36DRAFT_674524 [Colletotrichum falcatum]|nr:hypothetical protein LX36DRAFT_674524 [Colletotrichum falcatum]
MPEPESTASLIACYFPPLTHDHYHQILKEYRDSIHIIGDTNDGCYTEIAVDSACIFNLAKVFTFGINLRYFILPPWSTIGLEQANSSYNTRMTYLQILAFCGLLIDADSLSLGHLNDDRRDLHIVALLRCLFELAGGDVDQEEIYDIDKNICFAENIRLCAEFVDVHCSEDWTLRLAKNIDLCESVINLYSAPAATESEVHQPLYLVAIAAAFAFNRSSCLQHNHTNVFEGIQELGILLPNNTPVRPVSPL